MAAIVSGDPIAVAFRRGVLEDICFSVGQHDLSHRQVRDPATEDDIIRPYTDKGDLRRYLPCKVCGNLVAASAFERDDPENSEPYDDQEFVLYLGDD